jgi:hypothetical protein
LTVGLLIGCANENPVATITSHVTGDMLTPGDVENFTGQLTDDRSEGDELVAGWWLGGQDLCTALHPEADGQIACEALIELDEEILAAGQVELVLEVIDRDDGVGTASILLTLEVSGAPVVVILGPEDGEVLYSDTELALLGLVSHERDDLDSLVVWWTSDLDGDLSPQSNADEAGEVTGVTQLTTTGSHELTLSAEDSNGAVGSASVTVSVYASNVEPTCEITDPPDGTSYEQGTAVLFSGRVDDFEDGFEGLEVTWASDLDGVLETFSTPEVGELALSIDSLSLGAHTISLNATDTGGLSCSDSILYIVGSPPQIVIDDPENGADFNAGDSIRFQATVSDTTDASQDLGLVWFSDVNGPFSTQGASSAGIASFETTDLGQGTHNITVVATDSDGFEGQASITIMVNGLPEAPELSLTPDPAYTADALEVEITVPSIDPEGDPVTYTYEWSVGGNPSNASTGVTLPSSVTDKGETWAVVVTPDDGKGDGASATLSVTISNTPPELIAVDLGPENPVEGDTLTCTPGTSADADGDSVAYSYAWTVDGTTIGAVSDTLDDGQWDRDQSVTCWVTPNDGTEDGVQVSSNTVNVENTPPGIVTVSISPDPAVANDTLVCSYAGYSDADGDTDQSTYSWVVAGSTVGSGAELSGAFVGGELVTCAVTPNDGTDTGTTVSDSLVITNTVPSVTGVTIDPDPAFAGDAMVCSYSGYSDDDGDPDQSTYRWLLNGSTVGASAVYEGDFVRDDVLICQVTPDDGEDQGTQVSSTITITNTAPAIASISLSPASPQAGDTLTCAYEGYADPDGDSDQSTYSWTVDGVGTGSGGDSLSSGFIGGELVTCTVTPDDGTDTGTALTASATVGNTAPSIGSVTISPNSAVVGDTLTCRYTDYDDPDGNPDSSTYSWTVNGSTVSSAQTLSSGFVGGDEVVCTVTPFDGLSTGTALSDSLTISNTAPELTSATISPSSPVTSDSLSCSYSGFSDADGDPDQSTYAWTINGSTASTSSALNSGFVGGDEITCTVTPYDGHDDGVPVSDTVTVGNTAPVITAVSIDPTTAQAADTLSCSYSGYSDEDGDDDQSTYEWTVEGSTVGTESTLSGAFVSDDTVTCKVTAFDGTETGTVLSDSIVIDNTEPSISQVTISPSPAATGDTLTCTYSDYSDDDGDADRSTYAWAINGSTISTSDVLASGYVGGDSVSCTVTPDDGVDTGTPITETITIANTVPTITSVTISPSSPSTGDTLTCSYTAFTDEDGESDQSTYDWTVDGNTIGTSDTISSGFTGGDTVTCTVTPNDGNEDGTALSDSVTVENSLPSISSVTISPSTVQAADTLTCSYSDYSDADGDPDNSAYSWDVNGTEVGTDATLSGAFVGTDVVTCTVTPNDGHEDGTALSDSVTVDNTVPSIGSISLTPTTAFVGDTLVCSYSDFSDDDGDSDNSVYSWTLDGADLGVSGTTLSSGFVGGEKVACTVTPNDGTENGTALTTSVTISNTSPSIDSVAISPANAGEGETLTCSYSGYADADGDADQSTYDWSIDGTTVGTSATLTGGFVGGDTVTCTVTPNDGEDTGTALSDSITIGNTAPSLTSVNISPTSAQAADTLTCSYSGYSDADGDADQSTYAWDVDGTLVGTSDTLSGVFVGRDTVTCTVTPFDGTDTGSALGDSLTIDNTVPSISNVTISPASPQTGDALACSYTDFEDDDGDSDNSTYAWTINGTSAGTGASLSTGYVRDDTVTCTVTPNDGTEDGTALSDTVTVLNTAPSIDAVTISPTNPAMSDDLGCGYSGYNDADGDSDQSSYAWTMSGSVVGTTDTLTTGSFASGDTVTCTVTPNDGQDDGSPISASITVGNSAPSITSVVISPSSPGVGDTLTCSYSGYSDPDGDADQSTYRWSVGGSTVGTNSSIFSGYASGDTVTCTVTPFDGASTGTTLSDSVVVVNTAPILDSVSLTPTEAYEGDTLTCTPGSATDADGETISYGYAWTVSGTSPSETGDTLSDSFWDRDEDVRCTVTPNDGTDDGSAVDSNTITITNSAPVLTSVAITPSTPLASETLTCAATASDADSDTVSFSYSWTLSGSEIGSSNTLAGAFVGTDTVTCTVTPNDGTDDGNTVSDSVTVANTAPVLDSVALTPTTASEGDTLSCAPGTTTDDDGDAVTYSYDWTVDGSAVSETGSSLADSSWAKGQEVQCTVTPNDGTESGTSVTSNTVTILNSAPVLASVSLTPTAAFEGDTLTCAEGFSSDADGDSIAFAYAWTVDGADPGVSGDTLSDGFWDRDQDVVCTVTPNDGEEDGTAVASSTVTIANTTPTVSGVAISPTSATAADTLTCSGTGSDADGDSVTLFYSWTLDATEVGTSSTLSGAFVGGETVVCTITPNDGTDPGSTGSDSVTIDNTAPVLASASLTPDPAFEGDTLSCTPGSSSDADGDSVSYAFVWTVAESTVAATGDSLGSGFWDRDETVFCTVTPSDDTEDGTAVASNSVTISNTAPVLSSVAITPTTADADDTLTCSANASDADGDSVSFGYSWTLLGSEIGTAQTLSGVFVGGDNLTCTVTPNDGTDDGATDSDSITIGNTAPSISQVKITPNSASAGETLTCSYVGFRDSEGDADQSTYEWTVDGSVLGASDTLSSGFVGGDEVFCTVTPSDGIDDGTPLSDSLVIDNTAPVLASVSLTPTTAFEGDTLACAEGTATDADGDPISFGYEWTVAGSTVSETGSSLASSFFDRDEAVLCSVTPADGSDDGTTVDSNTVTISNTAPSITFVTITPASPTDAETLTCNYSGFSDADGDSDQSTYSWTVSGTEIGTTDSLSTGYSAGDTVICIVTPSDGTDEGTDRSDNVSVTSSNSQPTISSLTLSPSTPQTNSTLTASFVTDDADGDTVTVGYSWSVNGSSVSTSTSLNGVFAFDKDDVVELTLTADDGITSPVQDTVDVTIANTPPDDPAISVNDFAPGLEDILCAVDLDSNDDDSDTINYSFAWTADGLDYPDSYGSATGPNTTAETDDTVPAADTSLATTWICTVTPNDGDDDGTSASATATELSAVDHGFTTTGSSGFSRSTDTLYGLPYTISGDFLIASMSIDMQSVSASTKCVLALYTSSGDLVAYTDHETIASGANTLDVVSVVDVPAGDYYLAVSFSGTGRPSPSLLAAESDVTWIAAATETTASPPPDPFVTNNTIDTSPIAIYASGYE